MPSLRDLFLFDGKEESTLETVIKVESCLLSRRTDDDLASVALVNVFLFVEDVELVDLFLEAFDLFLGEEELEELYEFDEFK